jgi:Protein of unknown function (DUF2511)
MMMQHLNPVYLACFLTVLAWIGVVNGKERDEISINKSEYGDKWPFTVDGGVLGCRQVIERGIHPEGTLLTEVTFKTPSGEVYGLNGTAKKFGKVAGYGNYKDGDDITLTRTLSQVGKPHQYQMRFDIQNLIIRARYLCSKGGDNKQGILPVTPKSLSFPIKSRGMPAGDSALAEKAVVAFLMEACPAMPRFTEDIKSSFIEPYDPKLVPHNWRKAYRLEVTFKSHPSDKRLVDWGSFNGSCNYYFGGGGDAGWSTRSDACTLPCGKSGIKNKYNFFSDKRFDFLNMGNAK